MVRHITRKGQGTHLSVEAGRVPATARGQPWPGGGREETEQRVWLDYGVGVDCHSKFLAICILRSQGGRVLRTEGEFGVDRPSLLKARAWIVRKLGGRAAQGFRYCIGSTGTYHKPVLLAFGGQPSVVNPLLAGPTRRRTDVLDARLLAHHSITGLWPRSFVAPEDGLTLRVLWACRREAVRAATRATNRVNSLVLRFRHTIAAATPIRSATGKALLEAPVLGEVPDYPNVAPCGLQEHIRPVIASLMADLERQMAAVTEAERAALAFVRSREWPTGGKAVPGRRLVELLMTVPGVGQTTALAWLSEVVDPRRFRSSEQVSAFAGCGSSVKVSTGKVTDFVKRKGNAKLHRALLFAAAAEMRKPDSRLSAWGRCIAGRHCKGGYRKAVGAVARRLAAGLWHVHALGEPFDISKYHFGEPPRVRDAPATALPLSQRQMALLPPELRTAQDVVSAFWTGRLSGIAGLGDGAFAKISCWARDNRASRAWTRIIPLDYDKEHEPEKYRGPVRTGAGHSKEEKRGDAGRQKATPRDALHQIRRPGPTGRQVERRPASGGHAVGGSER